MRAVLRRAVEIRQGRDARALIYYAILTGTDAIPFIERWLVPRMRFAANLRGNEYNQLNLLILRLKQGRSLDFVDQPRERLNFKMR